MLFRSFNDVLPLAQAAHNSGGIVIAQVKRLKAAGEIHPMQVKVPGILVDYVVVAENEEDHWQTYGEPYNPAYTGAAPRPAAGANGPRDPEAPGRVPERRAVGDHAG